MSKKLQFHHHRFFAFGRVLGFDFARVVAFAARFDDGAFLAFGA